MLRQAIDLDFCKIHGHEWEKISWVCEGHGHGEHLCCKNCRERKDFIIVREEVKKDGSV